MSFIFANKATSHQDEPTNKTSSNLRPEDVLRNGNGIIFIETTDRMQPPHLVLCAVESAARIYPDRPIAFFMKGLSDINSLEDEDKAKKRFPTLLSHDNIYLFPLRLEEVFNNTPLLPWYKTVNPSRETYWTHVSSDGSRLALIWKYGGIYMDTDIISIRPIPLTNFLAAESNLVSSNGPALFTRILKRFFCIIPGFKSTEDIRCGNMTFTNPDRFYPVRGESWKKYYEVWNEYPTFNSSFALHLFNFANKEHYTMVPGSKTLVDLLYQQYCPSTYGAVLRKNRT
ncbi:hypothetical protein XELAEV_18027963mg [Xenopus laevis]|uniref:Alpha 1,4-glycosyltransferase domain-containing protein n=1 Tax=Xenopus laevis TaxID=8355 RepID=A0A974CYS5_XENLA|nr:hypothetical protein XELAEV_18027963mg [Xenopus laevis]